MLISSTTIILMMAANTAFADFPRLGALQAGDGFLPRQFTYRGSRLVFSSGIVALALISSALLIAFQASVTGLIPLYAIGVFLSFSLSQTGMAHRWWKSGHLKADEKIVEQGSTVVYEKGWQFRMVVNAFGAVCTFIVMILFATFKFAEGAWIIVLLIPTLVVGFYAIHHHYRNVASQLSLDGHQERMRIARNRVIMPVAGVHRGTLEALRFARTLSDDVTVVHVSIDPKDCEKIEAKWNTWGDGFRLVILNSPYRLFLEPLIEYIGKIDAVRGPDELITIVVPQFVPRHWWTSFLHARTAETLRTVLLQRKNIVIMEVPYQLN